MSEEKSKLVGANGEKLILSPDEAKDRIEQKAKRRFNSPNKYNISRDEAVSLAVQVGQEVYDQLRAEHALVMAELQKDMAAHFADIRKVVVVNMLDLQSRSVSYRIRFDFDYDVQRIKGAVRTWWDRNPGYWWYLFLGWLELHGFRRGPEAPQGAPGEYEDFFGDEPEHVGAPSELPSDPGIARVLVLDAGSDSVATD